MRNTLSGIPPLFVEFLPDYRRYRVPGGAYFFTVNLLERRQDTLVRHIDKFCGAVLATRRDRPFYIDAWVVLPDHMLCVWTLPPGDDDFSNRWKSIKILASFKRFPEPGSDPQFELQKVNEAFDNGPNGLLRTIY